MGRVFQRPKTHTEYILIWEVTITVDNATRKIVAVEYDPALETFIGREVYASKGRLLDVESGKVLTNFTRSRKVNL